MIPILIALAALAAILTVAATVTWAVIDTAGKRPNQPPRPTHALRAEVFVETYRGKTKDGQ